MESVLFRYGQQISKEGGCAVKGYVVNGGIGSGGRELLEERSVTQWEELFR